MIRRIRNVSWVIVAAACAAAMAPRASAEMTAGQKALFKAIPADAWAFVAIPSMEKLDAKFALLGKSLGMPIPFTTAMMAGQLGLTNGLDSQGGLAVVAMNVKELGMQNSMAMIIATTDPDAVIKTFTSAPGGASKEDKDGDDDDDDAGAGKSKGKKEAGHAKGKASKSKGKAGKASSDGDDDGKDDESDGLLSGHIAGKPIFLVKKDKFVILSPSRQACRGAFKSQKSLADNLDEVRSAAFGKSDLILSIVASRWMKAYDQELKSFAGMMAMMAGPQGGHVTNGVNEMMALLGQVASADVCLGVDDAGISLVALGTPTSGSDLADMVKSYKPRGTTLLTGLCKEKFLLAFGGVNGPESKKAAKDVEKQVDAMLAMSHMKEKVDAERLKGLVKEAQAFAKTIGDRAVSLSALPEGPDGIIGCSIVLQVDDSAKAVATIGELIGKCKKLSDDEEFTKRAQAVEHKAGAETIDGTKVDTITVNLKKMAEDAEEDDLKSVNKILGKEGILIRIAPAGKDRIVVSLGGGKSHFEKVRKAAESGETGMSQDGGISRVGKHLPDQKTGEVYIAVDTIVEAVGRVMTALGEEAMPFKLSNVNAPVAVSATVQGSSGRYDLFVPMELVTAFKDAYMSSMAGSDDEDDDDDSAQKSPAHGKHEKKPGKAESKKKPGKDKGDDDDD